MQIPSSLELNKPKFDVTLKGLLHGYKPAKDTGAKGSKPAFATGGYNLIVIGASVDGTTAYVKNIVKGDCPDNVLCIGADYVFGDNWPVDLHGFIIYLPELIYVSDGGMSQIMRTLEKMKAAMTEESDVQVYYGPGTMEHVYEHQFKRWLSDEAPFNVFDYNTAPEGENFVFNAKLFVEYGFLFRKERNGLHRQTYPILFPTIKADSVMFDIDLEVFSDIQIAQLLMRCKSVNPNLKRWMHRDLAKRLFEFYRWSAPTDFFGFLDREFDDRDGDRDTLTWADEARKGTPPVTPSNIAESSVGGGKTVVDVGPNNITIQTPEKVEVKGIIRLTLPDDATPKDVDQLVQAFHEADVSETKE